MIAIASIFGFLGSITAATLFFPQVWKSYKTKGTHDLAWSAIALGAMNGAFWIVYGLMISNPFIYITNIVLFIGALLLMALKLRYK